MDPELVSGAEIGRRLGVSRERLTELVREHGVSADAVRAGLRKKQHA